MVTWQWFAFCKTYFENIRICLFNFKKTIHIDITLRSQTIVVFYQFLTIAHVIHCPCSNSVDVKRVEKVQTSCLLLTSWNHITYKLKDAGWLSLRIRLIPHIISRTTSVLVVPRIIQKILLVQNIQRTQCRLLHVPTDLFIHKTVWENTI